MVEQVICSVHMLETFRLKEILSVMFLFQHITLPLLVYVTKSFNQMTKNVRFILST